MSLTITLKSKLEQFTRLMYINSITLINGSVLLVEYPKSGGTWLGQLISSYLEIPFPRNTFPIVKRAMYHSHYLPTYNTPKNKPIIYLVRDGRDVIISQYFHQLLWNEKNKLNPKDVHYHRSKVPFKDYDNIKKNLTAYIKYAFEESPSKWQQFTYMGNWSEYNKAWLKEMRQSNRVYLVKYEDLLLNPEKTLSNLLSSQFQLEVDPIKLGKIIETFSFEKQSNRKKGEENTNSFLRKGISGDWKNHFGEKEKELFKKYAGDVLIELDYEQDMNW